MGLLGRESAQMLDHLVAIADSETLMPRIEKQLQAFPGIRDQTGSGPRCLKDARRWRKTIARHALTIDIQDAQRCAIKDIVVACIEVAKIGHMRQLGHMLFPATTAKQKMMFWQRLGWLKKERRHPRFAVWQAIAQNTDSTC